jgi:hypothetical protein
LVDLADPGQAAGARPGLRRMVRGEGHLIDIAGAGAEADGAAP